VKVCAVWRRPHLGSVYGRGGLAGLDLEACLRGRLDWEQIKELEKPAPLTYKLNSGRQRPPGDFLS